MRLSTITRVVALILATATLATCSKSNSVDSMSQSVIDQQTFEVATSNVGIYNIGITIEKIDNATSQIYQSSGGKLQRVVSDEGNLLFGFELSSVPSSVGDTVTITYSSTTTSTAASYTTTVVKIESGNVWLWDAASLVGVVLLEW
ncbi:MAG: hypothetical protein R3Y68_06150 [Rikenellaceae bacterium]